MKLLIATPSGRDYKFQFATSLLNLMNYINGRGVNGKPAHLIMHLLSNASLLPDARQKSIQAAIDQECDYILMVDDDMQFPPDVVDRLQAHGVDVCAANYIAKGVGGKPTAMNDDGKIYSKDKSGIEEVGWIGLGLCLMRIAAIKDIPPPWFEVVWLPETKSYLGEDYFYCETLRRHNVKIHIDHDVSHDIGHIGDYAYRE